MNSHKKMKAARAERGVKISKLYPAMTLNRAAQVFGISKEKLQRALNEANVLYGVGVKFTIRQAFLALTGDDKKLNGDIKRLELRRMQREEAQASREVINLCEVREYILKNFVPLRDKIINRLPALAATVNPSDPNHALAVLEQFGEQQLKVEPILPPFKDELERPVLQGCKTTM
jgi:hypothetical protein